MKKTLCVIGLILASFSLTFAAGSGSGKATYDKACKSCHGADGTANANIAKAMKVNMQNLGDPTVQKLSDDQLKGIIMNGIGKMKPAKSVTGKDVDDVVGYVRTLK